MNVRRLILLTACVVGYWTQLLGQCGVSIEIERKIVCVPGKITLIAKGCSTCVGYDWDIGKGWISAGDTFSALVGAPGSYDVRLRVRYAGGGSCILAVGDAYVGRDNPKPVIRLSSPLQCSESDSIRISDETPQSMSRDWLIEGQYLRWGQKAVYHRFKAPWGYKELFVTVRDSFGCTGSLYLDSAVGAFRSVNLVIRPDRSQGCLPASVKYHLLADTFEQQIQTVEWTFPGAKTPLINGFRTPFVSYENTAVYGASVKIKTDAGCQYDIRKDSLVKLGDSALLRLKDLPVVTCSGNKVLYEVEGSKNGKTIWEWSPPAVLSDSISVSKRLVRFRNSGSFDLILREDSFGCISKRQYKGLVRVKPPMADFLIHTPQYCSIPDTLRVENVSIPDDSGATSYTWTVFGHDTTEVFNSNAQDLEWYPTVLQNWHIRLVAKGSSGCNDTFIQYNAITGKKLEVQVALTPNPACPNQKVILDPDVVGTSRKNEINYDWVIWNRNNDTLFKSKVKSIKWSSKDTGRFSFRVIASNRKGCRDTLFGSDSLKIYNPEVHYDLRDSFVCRNQLLYMISTVRNESSTAVRSWEAQNIDSSRIFKFKSNGDTAGIQLSLIGRYQLRLLYKDTAFGGCNYTVTVPPRIFVSGSNLSVTGNPKEDCIPYKSVLHARVLADVDFQNRKKPVVFKWEERYINRSILDSQKMRTTATLFRESQLYSFLYSGKAGCADTFKYVVLSSGVTAYFEASSSGRCRGDTIRFRNRSSASSSDFSWTCDDPSIKFFPSATAREPWFVAPKSGLYKITMIAGKQGRCSDTMNGVFRIDSIKANFFSRDSLTYCAPKVIPLVNSSFNNRFNRWTFNNNDKDRIYNLDKAITYKLMGKNAVMGIDVKLNVTSRGGCQDSLTRKNYLKIIGPESDFSLTQVSGCEPVIAKFENKSKFFKDVLLDYGNGSITDSFGITHHAYVVRDKSQLFQVYYPVFALYDSLGCKVVEPMKDSVVVFKGPEARFQTDISQGCAPLKVKFLNRTLFYQQLQWDVEGLGSVVLTEANPVWEFANAGKFRPKLRAVNANGCKDSFTLPYDIVVLPSPEADFEMSADSSCYRDTVYFFNKSKAKSGIAKFVWDFGDETRMDDLSGKPDSRWVYVTPDNKYVKLIVTDSLGCHASKTRTLHIHDTLAPVHPGISYVTLLPDNETIGIHWKEYSNPDFLSYRLFKDSAGYFLLQRFRQVRDTAWYTKPFTAGARQNFCFALRTEDSCNILNDFGISHCTILTEVETLPQTPFVLRLKWTPYSGWLNLKHYEVYRSVDGSPFRLLGMVKPWELEYYDSALCDKAYTYYVVAVNQEGLRSRSNESTGRPHYIYHLSAVPVQLATVEDSRQVFLRWKDYVYFIRGGKYHVQRAGENGYVEIGNTHVPYFMDQNARVNERSYTYRIVYKDHCGIQGTAAEEGTTIFLRGQLSKGNARLTWTPYRGWVAGVSDYVVQLRNSGGAFQTRAVVPGDSLAWTDFDIVNDSKDSLVYRVLAIRNGLAGDTSFSNYAILIPDSRLFAPTAFTPNGDGINDRFGARSIFIVRKTTQPKKAFLLEVYNRWGQLVFYTQNPDAEWDGTYLGAPCPDGAYAFRVKGVGFDGVLHVTEGTLQLIR